MSEGTYRDWVAVHPLPTDQRRHPTLAAVARRVLNGESVRLAVKEFLDELSFTPLEDRPEAIGDAPALVGEGQADAYLGAVAEYLAVRDDLAIPRWSQDPSRFLDRFWFVGATPGLRAYLLVRSPMAFRRRGIFVDPAILERR